MKATTKVLKTEAQKLYTLQVFLIEGPISEEFAGQEISRTIQIKGDQTLAHLHRAIFTAFDREKEHFYEFQFGKGPHDPDGTRYGLFPRDDDDDDPSHSYMPEGDVKKTKIDDLELTENRAFSYWFDFGDDWMHQINVVSIDDCPPRKRFPKIVARQGASPPQYPDFKSC